MFRLEANRMCWKASAWPTVIVINADATTVPTLPFIADVTHAFSISNCREWLALGVWLSWWCIDWEKPRLTNRSCWQMFGDVADSHKPDRTSGSCYSIGLGIGTAESFFSLPPLVALKIRRSSQIFKTYLLTLHSPNVFDDSANYKSSFYQNPIGFWDGKRERQKAT